MSNSITIVVSIPENTGIVISILHGIMLRSAPAPALSLYYKLKVTTLTALWAAR